jgi:hypothetical protein
MHLEHTAVLVVLVGMGVRMAVSMPVFMGMAVA